MGQQQKMFDEEAKEYHHWIDIDPNHKDLGLATVVMNQVMSKNPDVVLYEKGENPHTDGLLLLGWDEVDEGRFLHDFTVPQYCLFWSSTDSATDVDL